MFKRFLPQKEIFFPLFQEMVEKIHAGSEEFIRMLSNLAHANAHAKQISFLEKKTDQIARKIFDELHKTFVTPFDRDDIHNLTANLDSILDQINRASRRLALYEINAIPPDILILGNLCTQAVGLLKQAMTGLEKLSQPKLILQLCDNVGELDESADRIILTGMSHLFSTVDNFKDFFKMKEIYESFQSIFKSCKASAIVIKGIVLEYT